MEPNAQDRIGRDVLKDMCSGKEGAANWGSGETSATVPDPGVFFRPTPDGSRQVVYQAGKTIALCKFTELMQ